MPTPTNIAERDPNHVPSLLARRYDDPNETINITGRNLIGGKALDVTILDASGNPIVTFGSALSTAAAVGQKVVAVTGTAVQLQTNTLNNGVIVTNNGTTNVYIGGSGVNNTGSGSGNGYELLPGASVSFAVDNTNRLYINGTATTSWVSFAGS